IIYVDVYEESLVALKQLQNALTDETILVSIMFENNEIGTVQPMYDIEEVINNSNALFHVDAVQAIGHLEVNFHEFNIDAMSITEHKFGGHKGVGALLLKEGTALKFSQLGGDKESNRRE